MRSWPAGIATAALLVFAGCGGGEDATGAAAEGAPGTPRPALPASESDGPAARFPDHPVPHLPERPHRGPSYGIARVLGDSRVELRRSPGGEALAVVGPRSEFGSPLALAVVRRSGSWLGVQTPLLPNGEIAWIRHDAARMHLYWTKYSLHIDRSRRLLELRYGDRAIGEVPVTVGAPGSETPAGRFAITDALGFEQSPYYGCCALALSGHQPRLPLGWLGGDRIAIHGTPGRVGYAESLGCIRASDATMRYLFARLPLGAPVFVSA